MKVRTTGTGPDCLITPDHGASVVLSSGAEWCPNQAHDRASPPEPGILTRQQAWLDAKAKAEADDTAEAAAS
jgi:hypothetical protein